MFTDRERNVSIADIRHGDTKARFQQGRPILACDLDSNTDLLESQRETALRDIIGGTGFPRTRPGFALTNSKDGRLRLLPGHAYLDGVLVRNERAFEYDIGPSLPPSEPSIALLVARKTDYTYLERDTVREPALGGVDTAARSTLRSELAVMPLKSLLDYTGIGSLDALREHICTGRSILSPFTGFGDAALRLSIDETAEPPADHCLIRDDAGYLGEENANYRVEIHKPSSSGAATFKFARHRIQGRLVKNGSTFTIEGAPEDDVFAFATGQAVEVRDATLRRQGKPGPLGTITRNADGSFSLSSSITSAPLDFSEPVIILRWDHDPSKFPDGIPIPNSSPITLENGIRAEFRGDLMSGDYWECAARVETGALLWPPYETPDAFIGTYAWRRCAALAIVERDGDGIQVREDLREVFPELTNIKAIDVAFESDRCNLAGEKATVHSMLEALCARVDREGCTIRVRPKDYKGLPGAPYADVATYPDLDEVFARLKPFLSKTDTPAKGRSYLTEQAAAAETEKRGDHRVIAVLDSAFVPVQPDNDMPLRIMSGAATAFSSDTQTTTFTSRAMELTRLASSGEAMFMGSAETLEMHEAVAGRAANTHVELIAGVRTNELVENFANMRASAPASADERLNPYFLQRRLCFELMPGEHDWPDGLSALMRNLADVTIKGCCSGNVTLRVGDNLTFERCVDVALKNLNIVFGKAGITIACSGGKSVGIDDVVVTGRAKSNVPLFQIDARTRIEVRDARFRLTHTSKLTGLAQGLHIADTEAHTTLDRVQSNGVVVLGRGVPTRSDLPISNLRDACKLRVLRVASFAPLKNAELSSNSARIIDCRVRGVLPGAEMCQALKDMAAGRITSAKNVSFNSLHVDRTTITHSENVFVARNVSLGRNRFLKTGTGKIKPGQALRTADVSETYARAWQEARFALSVSSSETMKVGDTSLARDWAVAGISVGHTVQHCDNIGFKRTNASPTSLSDPVYSTLIEISSHNDGMQAVGTIEHVMYAMLRDRLFSFQSAYFHNNTKVLKMNGITV